MADNKLALFTIGQGKAIPVDHTGPVSYTTGGETVGNINNQTGITMLGLATIDYVGVEGMAASGSYWVMAQPVGNGEGKTFKLIWFTASAGVPTLTQVSAAVDLSAQHVRLLIVGR